MKTYFLSIGRCIAAVLLLTWSSKILAQDTPKPSENLPELPIFIITGTEKINIPGGTKKSPDMLTRLTQKELDALNALDKQAPSLLPLSKLPTLSQEPYRYSGFLRGEFGMFVTPAIDAGYRTEFNGFDIYARGGMEASSGHIDNAKYSLVHADITAGYLAPEKYWLFGGSKTDSYVRYQGKTYNLYAVPKAPERTTREFALGLQTRGNYGGFAFDAGIGMDNLILTQARDVSNNSLHGYAGVSQLWNGYRIGGKLSMDFRTLRGQGYNFIEATGSGEYISDVVLVSADLGIQAARNSDQVSQGALVLRARTEYRINHNFTLRGHLGTGLTDNTFQTFLHRNPYIDDSADVQYARVVPEIGGSVLYHPIASLALSAGVTFRMMNDQPVYVSTSTGTFRPDYRNTSSVEISGAAYWTLDSNNSLAADLGLTSAKLRDGSETVPYTEALRAALEYQRYWSAVVYSSIGLTYIGKRYGDLSNKVTLPGYANLTIGTTYTILERLNAFIRVENLLNSDIILWEGYKERGLFGSLGITWQF